MIKLQKFYTYIFWKNLIFKNKVSSVLNELNNKSLHIFQKNYSTRKKPIEKLLNLKKEKAGFFILKNFIILILS